MTYFDKTNKQTIDIIKNEDWFLLIKQCVVFVLFYWYLGIIENKLGMLKCIHILHLRVVKYTKEKNAMNVEARAREKKRNIEVCNFIGPLTSLYGC